MIKRRNRVDLYSNAELKIFDAIQAVEDLGADTRLTDAVVLLGDAKDKVADYIDDSIRGCDDYARPPEPESEKEKTLKSVLKEAIQYLPSKTEAPGFRERVDSVLSNDKLTP